MSAFLLGANQYIPGGRRFSYPYVALRSFYVDAVNGLDTNPGTSAKPWQTLDHANGSGLRAGDVVNVLPGLYVESGPSNYAINLSNGGNANSPIGYVVWRSVIPGAAKIVSSVANISTVGIFAPYIIFDGFEVDATFGRGTAIDGSNTFGVSHHIMVLNCIVHDSGAGGISLNNADYYTICGNHVFNCARTSTGNVSGISVWHPTVRSFVATQADDTTYRIVIQGNVCYGNYLSYPGAGHSDGNGIIADDWSHSQSDNAPYPYWGLIQGNLCFGNGGAGVAVYMSQNIVVANNTCVGNFQDILNPQTSRGDIYAIGSQNITFINNIAVAYPNATDYRSRNVPIFVQPVPYATGSYTGVTFAKNLVYPAISAGNAFITPTAAADFAAFQAAGNLNGISPSLNGCFAPNPGSPAISGGQPTASYPPISLFGITTPTIPNIGAY